MLITTLLVFYPGRIAKHQLVDVDLSQVGLGRSTNLHYLIHYSLNCLQLSQELTDSEGEARACHCLGFAHYSLGNYREAIRYYEQDLALAKDLKDQLTMARAFCNLGLAYKSLGQYSQALEYQYNFLQITHSLKNVPGKFRAMGNIGDILINMQNMQEAVLLYNQQLKLAKQV